MSSRSKGASIVKAIEDGWDAPFRHTLSTENQEYATIKTPEGERQIWRPVVALPYMGGLFRTTYRCDCGRKFKSLEDFNAHYIYKAVWENEANYIPEEMQKLAEGIMNAKFVNNEEENNASK